MYDLAIIGGGASGLAAAITASRRGKRVLLMEKEEKLGKKILVTGNGRCNLSATDVSPEKYNDPAFVTPIIGEDVVGFFHMLGVATKEIRGKIYPYSESATTVVNALRKALTCDVRLREEVAEIKRKGSVFVINGYEAKAVMLATGSNATFGTDARFLAEALGVETRAFAPSVVPLLTDTKYVKGAAGLRAKCVVSLVKHSSDEVVREEKGELLFKVNGLSGIACMSVAAFIARDSGRYDVVIDFLPDEDKEEAEKLLREHGAESYVHKAVAQVVEAQARARGASVYQAMRSFRVENARTGDMKNAQVAVGGLLTKEFDEFLQCKRIRGLYAGGEVLDVDGECGGYNLHFAFASGIRVGSVC